MEEANELEPQMEAAYLKVYSIISAFSSAGDMENSGAKDRYGKKLAHLRKAVSNSDWLGKKRQHELLCSIDSSIWLLCSPTQRFLAKELGHVETFGKPLKTESGTPVLRMPKHKRL